MADLFDGQVHLAQANGGRVYQEILDILLNCKPPEFLLFVRPEDAEKVRESLEGKEFKDQVEVIESEVTPPGNYILVRKDAVQWANTDSPKT